MGHKSFVGVIPMNRWESPERVSEWTRETREKLGLTLKDVAAAATKLWQAAGSNRDLRYQSIQQLEDGHHKGVPIWFPYVRKALEDAEDVSRPDYRAPALLGPEPDIPPVLPDEIEMIPEVDIRYAMGVGNFIADNPEVGQVPFNRNFRRSLTNSPVEKLFIARGDGDSMVPTLINDDMVLIDTTQTRIGQSDRIWAVAIGEAGMIKRVRVISRDEYELHSDNPAIRPQRVSREDLDIVGRVIWVGRRI
jgi:phage repressor protein C with HTH and peptisase S24 domain